MLLNEEEVRGKLILPYLSDLGISLSDISLEKTFKIRLGRTEHIISGRSDILCTSNGRNLFIIELKRSNKKISKNDVEQGISYARLLDNIAPFTIISNGIDTHVYDTITKERVDGKKLSKESDFWKNNCILSSNDDLKIRSLALENFISLSGENLTVFCKNQIVSRMAPISGTVGDSHAKFLKKLHLGRELLKSEFENFKNSNESIFCLIGNSGVGKTSSMCHLTLEMVESNFVMFYNAALLSKSPLEYLSSDLNLFFSEKTSVDIVLSKLNNLCNYVHKNLYLFIDSIDESTNSNLVLELSDIAHAINKFSRLKIIISCKSNIWNRFLTVNGTNTYLREEVIKYRYKFLSYDNNLGFHLKDFNQDETNEIIEIYRKAYNFKGELNLKIIERLTNGFFLRIFSEVYRDNEVPDSLNDIKLIEKYLELSLQKNKIDNREAIRILAGIGNSLVHRDFNRWDFIDGEGVDVIELLEDMSLPLYYDIPEDLFSNKILTKSNILNSYDVSFYYSTVRDYIICYYSFKLNKVSSNKFYELLDKFYKNFVGQSAISFYLNYASNDQLNILKKFKKDKSIRYLSLYKNYINSNFPVLRSLFDPKTDGKIGMILPYDMVNEDGYALVPMTDEDNDVIKHATFKDFKSREPQVFKMGARVSHGSHIDILHPNTEYRVESEIYKQLKRIVEDGKIVEDFEEDFLIEKVSVILYYNYKRLGYQYNFHDRYMPRYEALYPINLHELRRRLLVFRAERQYRYLSYSKDEIKRKALDDINSGKIIKPFNTVGDFPPYEELERVVKILIDKGHSAITKHYLPTADIQIDKINFEKNLNRSQRINLQFSDDRAVEYVEEFFKKLTTGYRSITTGCFPTIKYKLKGYNEKPLRFHFYDCSRNGERSWWYGTKHVHGDVGDSFHFKENASFEQMHKRDGINTMRCVVFSDIIDCTRTDSMPVAPRIRSGDVNSSLVLRNWFYKIMKNDFRDHFNSLGIE